MTAALERVEWSAARPGRTLPPRKTRYPFYRRLGGPQGRCGRAENLIPTGIRSRTVEPVVSRYTDRATGPTIIITCNHKIQNSVLMYLLHAANLRHGTDGFTSLPKEGVLKIFLPKYPTASAGFEPANLGTEGQHATLRSYYYYITVIH